MKKNIFVVGSSLVAIAAIGSAVPALAQEQATPPQGQAAQDSVGIGDIVVTARRRAESIQTAPVSVTALGGEALTQKNIVNVADLASSTPGLGIRRASNTPNAAVITIRGQVQSEPNITTDPSVGVYIGDMYVARAYGVLGDLLDMERVEVLRGPQGSLFGRNTIGGAIRIIPKKPDVTSGYTGFFNAGVSNFAGRSISGAITVPVIEDKLAIRYAGSYRKRDGYATGYLVNEPDLTPVGSIKMNDVERESHRLSLAWRPTDTLRVDLSGYLFHSSDNGALVTNVSGDITETSIISLDPFRFTTPTFRNSPQRASDFYSALIPVTPRNNGVPAGRNVTKYVQGTAEYDLTDKITAKITLSALKTDADAINQNTSGVVTDSIALVEFTPTNIQRQTQKTAEFQLQGKSFDNKLSWILGAYYFQEKGSEVNTGITKVFGDPSTSVDFDAQANNRSKSLFGYGDISLTDRLSITLGARYTWDTKSLLGRNRGTFSRLCVYQDGPNIVTSTTPNGPCLLDRTDKFSYFTYDTGINYKLANDLFLYVKANNGVRSGGQQPRAVNFASSTAFDPDKAYNYEAGVKADLFDRRLRVNASGYHVDYKNVQQQIILAPPDVPTTTTQIANLGNAKINGFEVETTARPFKALTLEGNVAYVKVKYDNPNTVQRFSPEWQYTLAGTYDLRLGDDAVLRLRADYNHITSFYMAQNISDPKLSGYGLLNLRASYLIGDKYNIALYATNVTNKKYYASGIISANLAPATVGEPRIYGAEFTYSF
jgi:iron complex outermembrane receptor protein